MKKGLFLLPLLAAFALCGCGDNGGGGSGGGGGGSGGGGGGGGGGSDDVLVLDFGDSIFKDEQITPYVKNPDDGREMQTFDYEGITFNDWGCYADTYDGDYYLMMKNTNKAKDYTIGQVEMFAFLSNSTEFDKEISKVEIETRAGSSTKVSYVISLGDEEFTEAQSSGAVKKSGAGVKITATAKSSAHYFAVSTIQTGADSDFVKNGQLKKISIYFK